MQQFVRGDQSKPTGNLVAFAEVIGRNPIDPDGSIIAVNIAVSALSAQMSHYPVVVFPPSSYRDRKQLDQVLDFMGNVDLVQLEPFSLPANMPEDEYFQQRMDDLNKIVQEYVDLFQKSFLAMAQSSGLELFNADLDFFEDDEQTLDLGSSLNRLETLLQTKADIEQYKPIIRYIRSHHPELDVWNFEQLVRNSKHEIAELYIKKFRAIAEERYEAAAFFQNRIIDAEPGYNS